MININYVKSYCSNYELIENYQEAINSPEVYDCHHKNEIDMNLSRKELIDRGLYYNRPPEELIFMTRGDHIGLHNTISKKGNKYFAGRKHNENTKKKMSENHADVSGSNNYQYKFICPIKLSYMYFHQCKTINQVGEELGVSRFLIWRRLKELKLTLRK